jgi:hypothetical protein
LIADFSPSCAAEGSGITPVCASSRPRPITVRKAIEDDPGVTALHALTTMHMGPPDVIVMATVQLTEEAEDRLHATIARLHRRVTEALGPELKPRRIAIEPAGTALPSRSVVSRAARPESRGQRGHRTGH